MTGRRGLDSLAELSAELPERFGGRSVAELALEVDEVEAQTPLGEVREVPGARLLVERLRDGRRAAGGLHVGDPAVRARLPGRDRRRRRLRRRRHRRGRRAAASPRRTATSPPAAASACAPADAVGFEDSVAGVAAVVAAGLTCVGVLTHATAAALAAAHAVLDDLTQVDRLGWPLPAPRA